MALRDERGSTQYRTAQQPTSPSSSALHPPPTTPPPPTSTASSPALPAANRAAHQHNQTLPTTAHAPVRSPNPAKKVTGQDELHSAITRQAVAEERKAASKGHSPSNPRGRDRQATAVAETSPQSSSPTLSSRPPAANRVHPGPTMAQRTVSIDSTVSSISSATSTSQRLNSASALRVSQDNATLQDPASLIAAHGSAEAALVKVLAEKQQAASHNAQLWRLVEKQRMMILGLNKDLERSLKDKERYRRKLKDHLATSVSAPELIGGSSASREPVARADSQSPLLSDDTRENSVRPTSRLGIHAESRKASDSSDTISLAASRSDTPQDIALIPLTAFPAAPQSSSSMHAEARGSDRMLKNTKPGSAPVDGKATLASLQRAPAGTPPMSIETRGHQMAPPDASQRLSPPPSAQSYSSPKTRKAPPAPLKLERRIEPEISTIVDASDSEYEEDPESARSEHIERGRRKTREDDDRERETLAELEQEEEQRNQVLQEQQESTSKTPTGRPEARPPAPRPVLDATARSDGAGEAQTRAPIFHATANPAEMLRHRAISDAAGLLPRHNTAPSLLSPGLPMSPRPGDRPMNSPMPRAPLNAMPMSPRSGMPLSPRPPTKPIPMPPQTPLGVMSPHLDRAKGYHKQMDMPQQLPSYVERLKGSSLDASPELEPRASTASERNVGDVFRGFATDQYPDLLLPPNALASIYVKTSSSRMKPSRHSFVAPKFEEISVFTLAVIERADNGQLWRVEKAYSHLASLDQQLKPIISKRERFAVPDKTLFTGHAPSRIDDRRVALDRYFEKLMDCVVDEKAALIVCKFLSSDTVGPEGTESAASISEARADTPINRVRPSRAGYLTKRGKNFGGWKARYFVLDGPNLKYFEGPGGAHLGSIKLQNAQIGKQSSGNSSSHLEEEENQYRHAFLILEPKKKDSTSLIRHVLCAESDPERDNWVDALLQYVDYKDDDDLQLGRQGVSKVNWEPPPKSPGLKRSMTDIRPGTSSSPADQVRAVGYNETIAGDAPLIGAPPPSPRFAHTPSPPYDKTLHGNDPNHPTISRPSNLQVIQNTGDWGMKPPPTPGSKDKKRSVFQMPFNRGRSSLDLQPGDRALLSPGLSNDRHSSNPRAVFGVPIGEAVEVARPANAETDLPAVFYRCIEYLVAKNAMSEEGIFRLSGSTTVIKALKDRFNAEGDINLLAEDGNYDVHAVASLLKLYLRDLPITVLTRELHIPFINCLEMVEEEKIYSINALINQLPLPNRALLDALSAFLLMVVDNVAVNKMNVRNLGVVFSPTLNVPAPMIQLFIEEQARIFGPQLPMPTRTASTSSNSKRPDPSQNDFRSPRKQMFSDLPTPGYNQTAFSPSSSSQGDDTGMIPMRPQYANYQMAPQGEGGYGSMNDALRTPNIYNSGVGGTPTPRDVKAKRRESGVMLVNHAQIARDKAALSKLREYSDGADF